MTYSPTAYARAFIEATRGKGGETFPKSIHSFLELIQKHGDWPRRNEIIRKTELLWRKENKKPLITIESARHLTNKQRTHIHSKFGGIPEDYEEKIVAELIAGIRITVNDERAVDASLAHMLKKIFTLPN